VPQGVTKVLDKAKKKSIYSTILSSDVIIFDINFGSTDDVDQIVKFLKEQPNGLSRPLMLIVLSSIMSWAGTESKKPREVVEQSDDENLEDKDRLTTTDFIEEDYMVRMPSTRFAKLKQIENLVL